MIPLDLYLGESFIMSKTTIDVVEQGRFVETPSALVWKKLFGRGIESFNVMIPDDAHHPVAEMCFESAHPDWLLITGKLINLCLCYAPVAVAVDRNIEPLRWAIAVNPDTYDIQALAADIEEDGWILSEHILYSPESGTALDYDDLIADLLSRPIPKTLIAEIQELAA